MVLQITSPKLVFRDASENYIQFDMSWDSLVLPCSGAPKGEFCRTWYEIRSTSQDVFFSREPLDATYSE